MQIIQNMFDVYYFLYCAQQKYHHNADGRHKALNILDNKLPNWMNSNLFIMIHNNTYKIKYKKIKSITE